ncbi:MAG: hypothetical protein M3540_08425 [Actinomycetota bacterium]|nr:hypothetical protein [Actinomycetota bacterium]
MVVILDESRRVAPPEDVVAATVPLVEGLGVPAVQVAHALVEIRLEGLDDEVVVVVHQAVPVDAPPVPLGDPGEKVDEEDAVLGVAVDRRAAVTAG